MRLLQRLLGPASEGEDAELREAIRRQLVAIEVAANEPDMDDEGLVDVLVRRGTSDLAARRLVVLAPIAFGRQVIEAVGVTTSPELIIMAGAGRAPHSMPLDCFVEYRVCRAIAADKRQNVFRRLSTWGAEFGTVAKLMNEGSKPEDLVTSSVVTLWDIR